MQTPDRDPLDHAGEALFRFGRHFARPAPHRITDRREVELSRIRVVEALDALGGEGSVAEVAQALDVEASTASRLVAGAIDDGLVRRKTARDDARRARLSLTKAGAKLAADARAYQRRVFDDLTADWSADDKATFARLFTRFSDQLSRS